MQAKSNKRSCLKIDLPVKMPLHRPRIGVVGKVKGKVCVRAPEFCMPKDDKEKKKNFDYVLNMFTP